MCQNPKAIGRGGPNWTDGMLAEALNYRLPTHQNVQVRCGLAGREAILIGQHPKATYRLKLLAERWETDLVVRRMDRP